MKGLLAMAALAAPMILGACSVGGGSDVEDFIARGDEICRDGQGAFRSIQATPPRSAKDAAAQARKLVATTEGEIDQLRALKAPEELKPALEAYLAAREKGVALLRKAQAAAEKNDPQGYVNANEQLQRGQKTRADLARKVGFKICSNPRAAPAQTRETGATGATGSTGAG